MLSEKPLATSKIFSAFIKSHIIYIFFPCFPPILSLIFLTLFFSSCLVCAMLTPAWKLYALGGCGRQPVRGSQSTGIEVGFGTLLLRATGSTLFFLYFHCLFLSVLLLLLLFITLPFKQASYISLFLFFVFFFPFYLIFSLSSFNIFSSPSYFSFSFFSL